VRDIKFRFWDIAEKTMETMYFEDLCSGCYYIGSSSIAMQYTGLKDKNGTEICEGDIIATFDYEATIHKIYAIDESGNNQGEINRYSTQHKIDVLKVVKWHENSCSLTMGNIWPCGFSMEVVGNIYENPELLI